MSLHDESRVVFRKMLQGEATTEEYVASVERDVRRNRAARGPYKPLSARRSRRKNASWWWKGRREALALWLAPWLDVGFAKEDEKRLL